jgi:hypothetical protein
LKNVELSYCKLTFEMSDSGSESSEEEIDLNQAPRTWKQAVFIEKV